MKALYKYFLDGYTIHFLSNQPTYLLDNMEKNIIGIWDNIHNNFNLSRTWLLDAIFYPFLRNFISPNNNNNINIKSNTDNANSKTATATTKTVVRAKEILGEAADAVADSFAKNNSNQQGMNKGKERGRKQGSLSPPEDGAIHPSQSLLPPLALLELIHQIMLMQSFSPSSSLCCRLKGLLTPKGWV